MNHIAFIMDGNGRWATKRGLPRIAGHKKGLEIAKQTINHAIDLGIKYISLYVFSTENWKRPQSEVDSLFELSNKYLSQFEKFCDKNIRVVVSGKRDKLPLDLLKKIDEIEQKTKNFNKIIVNLCVDYGGQTEIVDAVNKLIGENLPISIENIQSHLYNNLPAPDLIVRTGGQKRLSNFLLFQSAYSELYFTDVFWPDFNESEFDKAIMSFNERHRRFGGV